MQCVYFALLTNCHRLDPDTFLEVRIGRIIGVFRLQDLLSAEGVDEGCSA